MSNRRPTALLVSPVVPASTGNGLAMRAAMTLRGLAHHYRLHLLIIEHYPSVTGNLAPNLAAHCQSVTHLSIGAQHEAVLDSLRAELQGDLALVHFFRLSTYAHHARLHFEGARIHLDLDDVESQSRPAIAELLRSRGRQAESRYEEQMTVTAERQEIAALLVADRVYVANAHDVDRLPICGPADIRILPNVVDLPDHVTNTSSGGSSPFTFLFAGTLTYAPNEDGLLWFADEVLPIIRAQSSRTSRVVVVGHAPSSVRQMRIQPEIEVLGWVPDLEVIYRDADAVIIPLRAGGGTRIKLLEAAAHRRPVVTTTIGAEGIDVTNGRDCLIADNATDFAAACVRLANDPALAARLGRHGEDLVRSRYTLSAMIDALHPR